MITTDIAGGMFDDQLDAIVQACRDRTDAIAHHLFADLMVGDKVRVVFSPNPKYLVGATGTVQSKRITKVTVLFDLDIHDPYGKYAGKVFILPVSMIGKIED